MITSPLHRIQDTMTENYLRLSLCIIAKLKIVIKSELCTYTCKSTSAFSAPKKFRLKTVISAQKNTHFCNDFFTRVRWSAMFWRYFNWMCVEERMLLASCFYPQNTRSITRLKTDKSTNNVAWCLSSICMFYSCWCWRICPGVLSTWACLSSLFSTRQMLPWKI